MVDPGGLLRTAAGVSSTVEAAAAAFFVVFLRFGAGPAELSSPALPA